MTTLHFVNRRRSEAMILLSAAVFFVFGCADQPSLMQPDGSPAVVFRDSEIKTDFLDCLSESDTGETTRLVWIVPQNAEDRIPCANRQIPFTFSPKEREFSYINGFWMMWASFRSFYSDEVATASEFDSIGFDRYRDFNNSRTGFQAYIAGSDDSVILAFRGSIEIIDWISDLDIALRDGDAVGQPGKVHRGISRVLEESWPELELAVADFASEGQPIWVTGHSLGGALATLAASRLAGLGYDVGPLYTFAQPRVGDEQYAKQTWQLLREAHYRYANGRDVVPRLPPSSASAPYAADLFPVGLLGDALRNLFIKMDYTHSGILVEMGQDGILTLHPAFNEKSNISYWTELVTEGTEKGLLELMKDIGQDVLHHEGSYMCEVGKSYIPTGRRD